MVSEIVDNFLFTFYAFFAIFIDFIKKIFDLRRKCDTKTRIDGKVVVITGANTGIGKETAYQLSLRGAEIIIGCRDMKKAESAVNDIKTKNSKANISALKLDLSSLKSIRQFVKTISEKVSKIDILINNAGVFMCPEMKTEDGFEMQFGTNYLGHFLLTLCLVPLLKKSSNARVVNVSAELYRAGQIYFENINLRNGAYNPMKGYAQSKLANILFTREMARRLGPNSNIKTYSLHPGVIFTELQRYLPLKDIFSCVIKFFFLTIEMGAQTTLYCAIDKGIENETGQYYDDCKRVDNMLSKATDDKTAERLWNMSCDLVKLEDKYKL